MSQEVLGAGLGRAGGQSPWRTLPRSGVGEHFRGAPSAPLPAPLPGAFCQPPGWGGQGPPPTCALTFSAYLPWAGQASSKRVCVCVCVCVCVFRVFLKQLCSCARLSRILRWELGTWLIVGLFWARHYWGLYSVSVRRQHRCRLSWGVPDASWEAGPRVRWGPCGLSEWQGGHLPGAAPFRSPMGSIGLAWGVLPRPRLQGLLCRDLPA